MGYRGPPRIKCFMAFASDYPEGPRIFEFRDAECSPGVLPARVAKQIAMVFPRGRASD